MALAVLALLVGMPVLLWFSWLRETPSFWTNAGGYPVWLRDVVRYSYYPLLLGSLGGTALYFALLLSRPPHSRAMRLGGFAVFVLMVGVLAAAIVVDLL